MAKAPGSRYGSCQQFSDALGGALGLVSHPLGLVSHPLGLVSQPLGLAPYHHGPGPDTRPAAAGPAAPAARPPSRSAATSLHSPVAGRPPLDGPKRHETPAGPRPWRRNRYVPAALRQCDGRRGRGRGRRQRPGAPGREPACRVPRAVRADPRLHRATACWVVALCLLGGLQPGRQDPGHRAATETGDAPGRLGHHRAVGRADREATPGPCLLAAAREAFSPDGILAAAGGYGHSPDHPVGPRHREEDRSPQRPPGGGHQRRGLQPGREGARDQ